MSDDYDENSALDDGAFFKQLQSDVEDEKSLKLLMDVYDTNDMWTDFQEEDIQQVVETFSILNMAPGEKLITKGEFATFCGIILQGTFSAIVSPTFTVALRAGDMIGEMALFEGGARNADIVTGTDPEGCILAVITYVDLDNLAMNERYSQLARKLTTLFATASIKKLRGMLTPAPASASTAAPATPTVAATPAATAATDGSAEQPAAAPPATPATGTVATPAALPAAVAPTAEPAVKKREKKVEKKPVVAETLYKNKMAKNGAAPTTVAPSAVQPDSSTSSSLPVPKNMNEATKMLEDQFTKLKQSQHAKRNQQVMLDKLNKNIRAHEETIRQHEDHIVRLTMELKASQESLKDLTARHLAQTKQLEETSAQLEAEKENRLAMEQRLTSSASDFATRTTSELTQLKADYDKLKHEKAELELSLQTERTRLADLVATRESELAQFNATTSDLRAELDTSSKEATKLQHTSAQLETELHNARKSLDEHRIIHASQNMRLLDLEEKLSAAMAWKLKALEFQSGLDAEKKRHMRLSDDWNKTSRELEHELRMYKLLLKTFTITIYVKEFRLRKLIGQLHKRISEMLLNTLEEHYNTASGKEKLAVGSGAAGIGGKSGLFNGGGGSGSGSSSSSSSSASSMHPTFKSLRKRKKLYLDNLLKPSSKFRDIVVSLSDEFSKLRGPFEEIRERCLHWRATSESFFQRNIDLAAKVMTIEKSLGEANQAKENALTVGRQASKDLERFKEKHADFMTARLGSGGNVGSSNPSSSSSSSLLLSSNDKSSSHPSASPSRAELDMLDARATVLRVHVQQLESHYLQLQQAIHHINGQAVAQAAMPITPMMATFQEAKQQQQPHSHIPLYPPYGTNPNDWSNDRYDPALVTPVPLTHYGTAANNNQLNPSPPSHHHPSSTLSSPRNAFGSRGSVSTNTSGATVFYHPSHAPQPIPPSSSSSSSAHPSGAHTARSWHSSVQSTSLSSSSPSSASSGGVGSSHSKGEVISLRTLREQQQSLHQHQQSQSHSHSHSHHYNGKTPTLPAVNGAQPLPTNHYTIISQQANQFNFNPSQSQAQQNSSPYPPTPSSGTNTMRK